MEERGLSYTGGLCYPPLRQRDTLACCRLVVTSWQGYHGTMSYRTSGHRPGPPATLLPGSMSVLAASRPEDSPTAWSSSCLPGAPCPVNAVGTLVLLYLLS